MLGGGGVAKAPLFFFIWELNPFGKIELKFNLLSDT